MAHEPIFEATLLTRTETISAAELLQLGGLRDEELEELVDFGVIEPLSGGSSARIFSAHSVTVVRCAYRLKTDFELNGPGTALALTLLERIGELEAKLSELECRVLR